MLSAMGSWEAIVPPEHGFVALSVLMVAFDAEAVQPSTIVRSLRNHGWHAATSGF